MAPFNLADEQDYQRLDWQILHNGAISLYFDQTVLEETLTWFHEHDYRVYDFECTTWISVDDFYRELSRGLDLPDFCVGSLDALSDCLIFLDVPYEGGSVLVFRHFEIFSFKYRVFAQQLLDIIQITSRFFSLQGRRLIGLVQSDDPKIAFEPVGACPIVTNPIEHRRQFRKQLDQARERLARSSTRNTHKSPVWKDKDKDKREEKG